MPDATSLHHSGPAEGKLDWSGRWVWLEGVVIYWKLFFPITSNIQLILSIVIHLNRDLPTHWLVVHNLFVKYI